MNEHAHTPSYEHLVTLSTVTESITYWDYHDGYYYYTGWCGHGGVKRVRPDGSDKTVAFDFTMTRNEENGWHSSSYSGETICGIINGYVYVIKGAEDSNDWSEYKDYNYHRTKLDGSGEREHYANWYVCKNMQEDTEKVTYHVDEESRDYKIK
jgi:hypothetical protein